MADRIHWLGQLRHAEVPVFLAGIDVAIAPYPPSATFSFSPLKLYEYLAAGVPVVGSDIGQVRTALQDGRFGRLVPPGDEAALAAAIALAVSAPDRQNVSTQARRYALTMHGWQQRAEQLTSRLESLLPLKAARHALAR